MLQLQLPRPLVLSHPWVYQPNSRMPNWHPDPMGACLGKAVSMSARCAELQRPQTSPLEQGPGPALFTAVPSAWSQA